jgi:hypothetical protein
MRRTTRSLSESSGRISRGRASGQINGNAEIELKRKGRLIWKQIIGEERAAGQGRITPHNLERRFVSNSKVFSFQRARSARRADSRLSRYNFDSSTFRQNTFRSSKSQTTWQKTMQSIITQHNLTEILEALKFNDRKRS